MGEMDELEIESAIDFARSALAVDVAEIFLEAFGEPDAAETFVDTLVSRREMNDLVFWQDVITALAQIRG